MCSSTQQPLLAQSAIGYPRTQPNHPNLSGSAKQRRLEMFGGYLIALHDSALQPTVKTWVIDIGFTTEELL